MIGVKYFAHAHTQCSNLQITHARYHLRTPTHIQYDASWLSQKRRELAFSEKDPVTPISYWSTCHHAHTSCVISYLHTMRKREGRTNPSSHFVNIRFPRPTEHIICPAVGFSFIGYTLDVPFPMSKGRAATGHPRDPETIGRLASVVNQSQVSQTPDHNNTRYSGIDE